MRDGLALQQVLRRESRTLQEKDWRYYGEPISETSLNTVFTSPPMQATEHTPDIFARRPAEFFPTGLKVARGSFRERMLMLLLLFLDCALWCGAYIGLSELTGIFNRYGWAEVLLPMLISVFTLSLIGGYDPRSEMKSLGYSSEHLIACLVAFLVSAFAVYLVASFEGSVASSRAIFIGSFLAFSSVSLIQRRVFFSTSGLVRSHRRLLVISDSESGERFYKNCTAHGVKHKLHFFATGDAAIGRNVAGPGSPVYEGSAGEVLKDLEQHPDSEHECIVIATHTDHIDNHVLSSLVAIHFRELPVYTMHSFYETFWQKMPADLLSRSWPLDSGFQLVQHSAFASLKRLFDIVVSALTLIITSPILAVVAAIIKIEGRGPVFFSQTRVGQHGSLFTLYKFRTMEVGSESKGLYTVEGDPRVTRLGHWLRVTRLDELPQLWNVLRGEMSLIGPRAEWIKCVERYEKSIPYYHFRHLVRPGITGWAQVNYPYGASIEDTVEKLMFDLYYIRHFSLVLDATVILKTLHVMLFGKGR
jgi:exopolysaccharide biosynthesis polyprenyl glycosylphosphotransferase